MDALERSHVFQTAPEELQQTLQQHVLSAVRRRVRPQTAASVCFECGRANGLALRPCPVCQRVYFCSERCKRLAQSTHHRCQGGDRPLSALHWAPRGRPHTRAGVPAQASRPATSVARPHTVGDPAIRPVPLPASPAKQKARRTSAAKK